MQRRDPELLSRLVMYAVTRRAIYDQLAGDAGDAGPAVEDPDGRERT